MELKAIATIIMLALFTWMYLTRNPTIALVTWTIMATLGIFLFLKSR